MSVCFTGMLEMLSDHVRASVLGADSFQATHGVIVTWYRVTFAGAWCKSSSTYDRCQVSGQPPIYSGNLARGARGVRTDARVQGVQGRKRARGVRVGVWGARMQRVQLCMGTRGARAQKGKGYKDTWGQGV